MTFKDDRQFYLDLQQKGYVSLCDIVRIFNDIIKLILKGWLPELIAISVMCVVSVILTRIDKYMYIIKCKTRICKIKVIKFK